MLGLETGGRTPPVFYTQKKRKKRNPHVQMKDGDSGIMNEVIMELKNITKYFPGVVALDNMSFTVRKGMVHGLIGESPH